MQKEQRKRGIPATEAGLKILQAALKTEDKGEPLTHERIAEKTQNDSQTPIDTKTVQAFFSGKKVDRKTVIAICQVLSLEITEIVDPNEWHRVERVKTVVMNTQPGVDEWQGRQAEINELEQALGDDNIRLIGITAAGGYGKSALAVKLTEQLTPYWRVVLWASFNQAYGFAQFGRWVLEQFGQKYDEKLPENELIIQIVQALTKEPCLLVLDNLETVVTAETDSVYRQFLNQWLYQKGNRKLLLTSREKPSFSDNLLRLRRDHWLALQGLAEADAIRLVTVDYGLTGTETELALFVSKMGRHPLLMQLVCSSMVEQFGAGVTVAAADQLGLDLFTVEGYHRDVETSVGEVVAASLARLSPRLGDTLKRLSVLRESFDLGLAQGLTAEVTDAELRYLARLSLLQEFLPKWEDGKQTEQRRFEFLPLIKTFVQQQVDSDVLRSAHQAALDYFLAHLPAPPWESLEDVTAYLEGFYHAVELRQCEQAFGILMEEQGGEGKNKTVNDFLDFQGFNRQRSALYKSLISHWSSEQKQQSVFGYVLNNLGNCYDLLGEYKEAIAYHQQSLEIQQEIGNQFGIAMSFNSLGSCYFRLGEYKEAIANHKQSLEIQQASGNELGIADSLCNLGNCYRLLGEFKKAIDYHQQSLEIHLEIHKEIDNRSRIATSLNNLGNCYYSLEDYKEAIAYYQQSLEINQAIGNQTGIANALRNIGETLIKLEKYTEAAINIQNALTIFDKIGFQIGKAYSLNALAEIAHQTNQPQLALTHCQNALALSQELGIPLVKDCEELLAKIQESLGDNN